MSSQNQQRTAPDPGFAHYSTMRRIEVENGTGPVSSLIITEVSIPSVEKSDALVRIKAFGLNRMDVLQREGLYPLPPQAGPILGVEFSGIVESLGPTAESGFKVGDEVFGLAYGGAYAEYISVSSHMLIHKPKELTWEEAAGIPETWITAIQAMYVVAKFSADKTILWHAGGSAVSIAGIQLSKAEGAKAIHTTAGSEEKLSLAKSLGATHTYNYRKEDWAHNVVKNTDEMGVDIIIDFIGAPYLQSNFTAAARHGQIIELATLGGAQVTGVSMLPILVKNLRIEGSTLRSKDLRYQKLLRDMLAAKMDKFVTGEFKVFVDQVFQMTDIQAAHRLLEESSRTGKLICVTGL